MEIVLPLHATIYFNKLAIAWKNNQVIIEISHLISERKLLGTRV